MKHKLLVAALLIVSAAGGMAMLGTAQAAQTAATSTVKSQISENDAPEPGDTPDSTVTSQPNLATSPTPSSGEQADAKDAAVQDTETAD